MDSILQGTTPTLTIAIDPTDFDVSNVIALELAVQQQNNISVYNITDVIIDPVGNTVSRTFTQAETLAFIPGVWLTVQARFKFADGSIVGTNKMKFNVDDFISPEVL